MPEELFPITAGTRKLGPAARVFQSYFLLPAELAYRMKKTNDRPQTIHFSPVVTYSFIFIIFS